jgi:hypothetical protein
MRKAIVTVVMLALAVIACHPKYRIDFYKIEGPEKRLLSNEDSYFLNGFRISPNPLENQVAAGAGKVLVTNQSMPDPEQMRIKSGIITTEGKLNYRIYVQLPESIKKDSLNISGNSICQLVGRFNIDDTLKIYNCREGYILIDSVKSSRFFAILSGKYYNQSNDSLIFSGAVKVHRRD